MKKSVAVAFAFLLLVSCVLCACDFEEKKPFDEAFNQVSQIYLAFMETARKLYL